MEPSENKTKGNDGKTSPTGDRVKSSDEPGERKMNCGRKKNSGEQLLEVKYHGKADDFYKKQDWGKWWNEFSTSTLPNGALQYPTIWTFAKAKANGIQEQRWILAAIGPKAEIEKGRKRPTISWLGDWQKRRRLGWFSGAETAEALARVLKERANALEAARAVGGISAGWLRRVEALANQADDYFGGRLLLPELSVEQNRKRSQLYLNVMKELYQIVNRATSTFLACHGIHQDDVTVLARMQAVSIRSTHGTSTTLQGSELPEGITIDDVLLGKMMRGKAELYRMPLPRLGIESDSVDPHDQEIIAAANPSRFPNLAVFVKTVVTEKFDFRLCQGRIETYCRGAAIENLRQLRKEVFKFNRFITSYGATAMRSLLDKFGCADLQNRDEWADVANWFLTFTAGLHGEAWWEEPSAATGRERIPKSQQQS